MPPTFSSHEFNRLTQSSSQEQIQRPEVHRHEVQWHEIQWAVFRNPTEFDTKRKDKANLSELISFSIFFIHLRFVPLSCSCRQSVVTGGDLLVSPKSLCPESRFTTRTGWFLCFFTRLSNAGQTSLERQERHSLRRSAAT